MDDIIGAPLGPLAHSQFREQVCSEMDIARFYPEHEKPVAKLHDRGRIEAQSSDKRWAIKERGQDWTQHALWHVFGR